MHASALNDGRVSRYAWCEGQGQGMVLRVVAWCDGKERKYVAEWQRRVCEGQTKHCVT